MNTTWRKRPITVEAIRLPEQGKPWTREESDQALQFVDAHPGAFKGFVITDAGWQITTVDGNEVIVPWGAYVVIDSKGFAYPCDAEIFDANHDKVEGSEVHPERFDALLAAIEARRSDPEFMARIKASIEKNRPTLDRLTDVPHGLRVVP